MNLIGIRFGFSGKQHSIAHIIIPHRTGGNGKKFQFHVIEMCVHGVCVCVLNKAEREIVGGMLRIFDMIVCIQILIFSLSVRKINKSF